MSSNFGNHDDDDDADAGIPVGTKNYVTPEGHRALVVELDVLWRIERPKVVEIVSWAAGNGDRSENGDYLYGKKRLREIDRRVRFLRKRLERCEIIEPSRQLDRSRIYFGATVTYAEKDGTERTITIVGIDEVNADCDKVSWISPIARALMRAETGDIVAIRSPAGRRDIEIVSIRYPENAGG